QLAHLRLQRAHLLLQLTDLQREGSVVLLLLLLLLQRQLGGDERELLREGGVELLQLLRGGLLQCTEGGRHVAIRLHARQHQGTMHVKHRYIQRRRQQRAICAGEGAGGHGQQARTSSSGNSSRPPTTATVLEFPRRCATLISSEVNMGYWGEQQRSSE